MPGAGSSADGEPYNQLLKTWVGDVRLGTYCWESAVGPACDGLDGHELKRLCCGWAELPAAGGARLA